MRPAVGSEEGLQYRKMQRERGTEDTQSASPCAYNRATDDVAVDDAEVIGDDYSWDYCALYQCFSNCYSTLVNRCFLSLSNWRLLIMADVGMGPNNIRAELD